MSDPKPQTIWTRLGFTPIQLLDFTAGVGLLLTVGCAMMFGIALGNA